MNLPLCLFVLESNILDTVRQHVAIMVATTIGVLLTFRSWAFVCFVLFCWENHRYSSSNSIHSKIRVYRNLKTNKENNENKKEIK